ncbi:hypothetical protein Q428_01660 [Fervidicella metallireducens AeB]|uniref:Dipeptidylpeptidase IV N-terminal domain-containing protein n=1 Tax=Fervidicella metallireducens AeB TaxID=1403537 RepID=A0A017RYX6_9CLOT|nr:PD40 domain-containing protein [Fervidicella metallireducens]EYE89584.1 hypothetical protein Q428_01660 [Fervidicella metallireducens AeB]
MKKSRILIFLIALLLIIPMYIQMKTSKDMEAGSEEFSSIEGEVIYGIANASGEINKIDVDRKNRRMLFDKRYEFARGKMDKIIFFTENDTSEGIYLLDVNKKENILLAENYILDSQPEFSPERNKAVFLAHKKGSNSKYVFLLDLQTNNIERIDGLSGEIKHISFLNEDTILYSKRLPGELETVFQIHSYSFNDKIETRLINSSSNDINAVAAPNGKFITFLSDRRGNYNLYIINLSNSEIKEINVEDGVYGGSISWSPDSKKILYVTLGDKGNTIIKLSNLENDKTENVGYGYIPSFTKDGKHILYADYKRDTKMQEIYIKNIETKKTIKVVEFFQERVYSRCINLLYFIEK